MEQGFVDSAHECAMAWKVLYTLDKSANRTTSFSLLVFISLPHPVLQLILPTKFLFHISITCSQMDLWFIFDVPLNLFIDEEENMKALVPMISLMVIALMVAPAMGADDAQTKSLVYEDAIDDAIVQSRQMSTLQTSRSPNLRKKGHREASMAMFLETHRDELVADMMKLNLEPKAYKIERFLNDRFSCTCYATWAAK